MANFGNGLTFGPAAAKAVGTLYVATASVTVNSNTTATLVGSGSGSLTLPANFFVAGRAVRLRAWGTYTTTASPSTVTFTVKLGSVTVANTNNGTNLAPKANMSGAYWFLELSITCISAGASGSVLAVGVIGFQVFSGVSFTTANLGVSLVCSGTSPTAATIDTTASQAVDLQLTDAGTGTTIVCTNFTLEQLN